MTPTNTDLAAALREIADTLPLGSALIVRLAADRLTSEVGGDGWIEWENGDGRPDLPAGTRVEWQDSRGRSYFADAFELSWGESSRSVMTRYRIVK